MFFLSVYFITITDFLQTRKTFAKSRSYFSFFFPLISADFIPVPAFPSFLFSVLYFFIEEQNKISLFFLPIHDGKETENGCKKSTYSG